MLAFHPADNQTVHRTSFGTQALNILKDEFSSWLAGVSHLESGQRGLSPVEAIYQACVVRFRPIMMTTMAALLGALPLVLEHGSGSELRWPLGVTIIGGLLLSQLLTLYTTPAIYLAFERLRLRFGGAPAPVPAE